VTVTEIAVIVAAVLVGSLVKSVTGMGFPIIAVPIMSLYTGPATAIAVIAIPNAAQNLGIAWSHRRALPETKGLAVFCGVGVLGAVAGALTLGVVPEDLTSAVLVTAIAAWVFQALRRPDLVVPENRRAIVNPLAGALAGIFQGAAGISGPIVAAWHHGLRLSRNAFILSPDASESRPCSRSSCLAPFRSARDCGNVLAARPSNGLCWRWSPLQALASSLTS
jgi:uncharacterized membrane protein YfcA